MEAKSEKWIKRLLADQYRASFSVRFLSFCYDMFCLFLIWVIVGVFSTAWVVISSSAPLHYEFAEIREYIWTYEPHLFYISFGIQLLVVILYIFVLPLVASERRTLGMMLIGIKFLDANANEVTRGLFLKREVLKWLLFPGIIFACSAEKQSWADRLCKTYVTYY